MSLYSEPETQKAYAFVLGLRYYNNDWVTHGECILSRPKFNSTCSTLRLQFDGNLKVYTFYEHVDQGAWELSFTLYGTENGNAKGGCLLPSKCGELDVCENNQCVGCLTPKGLKGWTKSCGLPELADCDGGPNVDYFKVKDMTHFLSWYEEGDGPMKLAECREKCNKDCGCREFFYNEKSFRCLVAPELYNLSKVHNSSIVEYIKKLK